MLPNTSLIRFIVDLGRLICTWLQVNMLKEANPSFPYEAAAKKEEGGFFFFLFPCLTFQVIQKDYTPALYLSGLV